MNEDSKKDPSNPAITAEPQLVDLNEPKGPYGICVALSSIGRASKLQSDEPSDFIPLIESSSLAWVNFAVTDFDKRAQEVAVKLGFSDTLLPALLKDSFSNFEDLDTELGIKIPAVRIRGLEVKSYDLIILIRGNMILSLHSAAITRVVQLSRYADTYMQKLPAKMPLVDKLTSMLVRILDENNNHNFEQLRELEAQSDELSSLLTDPSTPQEELRARIYGMKHALVAYLNSLWRCLDVLNSLRYGDADVITDNTKILIRVAMLIDNVKRQINLAEHTSQVLSSGLEVVQTLYNNQLQTINNRMTLVTAWLTILGTALLVPNTIATIFASIIGVSMSTLFWYTNAIALATAGGTLLAYWWVRTRVIMPKTAVDTSALLQEPKHFRNKEDRP
jgi:magnesium transporter